MSQEGMVFGKALWGREGQGPALSSAVCRRGLGGAGRGGEGPAPTFTRSVAGPVHTPARPRFTSLPGGLLASRYR